MKLTHSRVRPLTRFYLVMALAAVATFSAMATGFGLFSRLVVILGLAVVLSYAWSWLALRALEVFVDRRTRQVQVGDTIEETFTIHNQSLLPKHALEVNDVTDLPGCLGGIAVSLWSKASGSWSVQARARKRGVYTLGPIHVGNTDPFGLFQRSSLLGQTERLIVYPRTYDLPGFHVPDADLSGDGSARKRTHAVTPHASTIREYSSGDSISRVHWNSTARLGKLMSKVFDLGRASEVWVLVDLHADVHCGELEESTDEYAASIGASLAKRYLEREMPVGLIAYGNERHYLPAETGAGQLQRVMDYLAMSKAEGNTPLEVALAREEPLWSYNSSLIVITPSPREDWVTGLRELAKRGVTVVVVLVEGSSFGGSLNTLDALDYLYLAGLPAHVVRSGDDIPAALGRRYPGAGAEATTPQGLQEVATEA